MQLSTGQYYTIAEMCVTDMKSKNVNWQANKIQFSLKQIVKVKK